jgi:hypothetical protein
MLLTCAHKGYVAALYLYTGKSSLTDMVDEDLDADEEGGEEGLVASQKKRKVIPPFFL